MTIFTHFLNTKPKLMFEYDFIGAVEYPEKK